jgi:hypothetical protein
MVPERRSVAWVHARAYRDAEVTEIVMLLGKYGDRSKLTKPSIQTSS